MDAQAKPAPAFTPQDGEGLAARAAALALVRQAVERRSGLDEALTGAGFARLPLRERAFARALAGTVLRRLGPIDQALDARLRSPPPEAVRALLRLGAAQVLFMEVPAHAAVATTVDLAGRDGATRPFKGLVNAVLRGLLREPPPAPSAEAHAPPWLFARWRAAYGEDTARAVAAEIAAEPPTDLTLKGADEGADLIAVLPAAATPVGGLRTARHGDLAEWPGYAEGRWWVQDAAAALPARLLDGRPGETVLDLCAAPGGKTLQLAAAGAQVTALDRSADRLKRLAQNLARTGLAAETVAADATAWADPRTFDAVLLDAPCSATGTFRRHPDVLWAARPGDIAKLAAVQAALLDAAALRVKPRGRLVYSVCSLEPEEGEAQATAFLARHADFTVAPVAPGEGGAPRRGILTSGALRLLPGAAEPELAGDGFFAVRFVRRG
jgi:16S rRNA (cytosine967-C5)-methyltransferase